MTLWSFKRLIDVGEQKHSFEMTKTGNKEI